MRNKFKVKLGDRRVKRRAFKKVADQLGYTVDEFAEIAAERVMAEAIASMRSPKSGILYVRPTGLHKASAPGESPAEETGTLIESLYITQQKINQYASAAIVTTPLDYARILEFFGPNYDGNRRPFLQPAVDYVEGNLEALFLQAWKRHNP